MGFHHKIIALTYPFVRTVSSVTRLANVRRPKLRVLMYHDVGDDEMTNFLLTIDWLRKSWKFLSPEEFENVISKKAEITQDSLLLTFDDGFASNLAVAEEILEPRDIRAIFFVIPDFIDRSNVTDIERFVVDRLKLLEVPQKKCNMTWDNLSRLVELGHTIGSHSMSHESLIDGVSDDVILREIIFAADRIEEMLSIRVRHFAFPFGDFSNIGRAAFKAAVSRYAFIHTGLRGDNSLEATRLNIRRDALKPCDSKSLVGAFLHGVADFRYRSFNRALDSWIEAEE